MSEEFSTLEEVAKRVEGRLTPPQSEEKKKVILLHAFNATGKTRLSNLLAEEKEEVDKPGALRYNAFFEDSFWWDNDDRVLKFDGETLLARLIVGQGLEGQIADTFKSITHSRIEPNFDFSQNIVTFSYASGDEESAENIKISKGEESVLIWSVFFTILETIVDALNEKKDDRSTQSFNDLEYVIIDDPVSSIDDTKIITVAVKLAEIMRAYKGNTVRFVVTTHHALFYNVLKNSFGKEVNLKTYGLSKEYGAYTLTKQGDTPFAYHLVMKDVIEKAIEEDGLVRYHFNMFRNLLEKTASFLGYKNYADCISEEDRSEFVRLVNLYSHSRLVELENKDLSADDKEIFQRVFRDFINTFNYDKK